MQAGELPAVRERGKRQSLLPGVSFGRRGSSLALADGLLEEVFDLAIDAAQFLLGPCLQVPPQIGVDAQQK